jgi:NADPH:quinone reductase-like Zn-dependent oxidoreductase
VEDPLGTELAGEIAAIGPAVTEFTAGDQVFGVNTWQFGASAEFVCMRENATLAHKLAAMSFEEAAAVCDGAIPVLGCLRPAHLWMGERRSLSRRVGLDRHCRGSAGQVLRCRRYRGVRHKNIETVRSLGVDQVIDYTCEDFTTNGQTYDVVFDAVGKRSFRRSEGSLNPGEIYLATDHVQNPSSGLVDLADREQQGGVPDAPRYTKKDVLLLKQLIEAGKYRAVINRGYPLEQVIDATRYVETKQKTGNVVLTATSGPTRSENRSYTTPGQSAQTVADVASRFSPGPRTTPRTRLHHVSHGCHRAAA